MVVDQVAAPSSLQGSAKKAEQQSKPQAGLVPESAAQSAATEEQAGAATQLQS